MTYTMKRMALFLERLNHSDQPPEAQSPLVASAMAALVSFVVVYWLDRPVVSLLRLWWAELLAFAVSSFYCGVAGALYAFCYLGSVEPDGFSLDLSLRILFMIIVGGVGSILGAFLGSAFILLLPILLDNFLPPLANFLHLPLRSESVSHIQLMVFGGLIIFFLIVEPHGLARLWQIMKEKLRLWPFPH